MKPKSNSFLTLSRYSFFPFPFSSPAPAAESRDRERAAQLGAAGTGRLARRRARAAPFSWPRRFRNPRRRPLSLWRSSGGTRASAAAKSMRAGGVAPCGACTRRGVAPGGAPFCRCGPASGGGDLAKDAGYEPRARAAGRGQLLVATRSEIMYEPLCLRAATRSGNGYEPHSSALNLNLKLRCLILELGFLILGKTLRIFGAFLGFFPIISF